MFGLVPNDETDRQYYNDRFQNYEIYVGDNPDRNYNAKCEGGPFMKVDDIKNYTYQSWIADSPGSGYQWNHGKEVWCNKQGQYVHIVADLSSYGNDYTLSICALGIMGTRYIRDSQVPLALEVKAGATYSFEVEKLRSEFRIGNVIDVNLRQDSSHKLDWVSIKQRDPSLIILSPTKDIRAGKYTLALESFDSNSLVQSTLRTDKIYITVTGSQAVEEEPNEFLAQFDTLFTDEMTELQRIAAWNALVFGET